MKFSLRIFYLCGRVALMAMAVLIIFAITPEQKLRSYLNVFPAWIGTEPLLLIKFTFVDHAVLVPEFQLPMFLLLLILALILLSWAGREIVIAVFKQKLVVAAGFLSLAGFLFTLTPAPPTVVREYAWYTVIYLLGSSFGMGLLLLGVYPLVNELNRWRFCRRIMISAWEKMEGLFLNVKPALFLGSLFVFTFALTNLAAYYLFEHIPHITDSIAQVFHGKIFAEGRLTVPSHAQREFFDFMNAKGQSTMINNGKWYSQYPPGHSFMLMWGILFDAPWIVNPLLGSLTVVMLYFLGAELYDKTNGRLAAALGAFSPFMLFMSSEFMNHTSALFFFTVFMLFFAKTVRFGKTSYAVAAGASVGMVLLTRPLTAVGLAIPFCMYGAYLLVTCFRKLRLPMTAMAMMTLVFAGILLVFNAMTNGDPWLFGYEVIYGPEVRPGFDHAAWGEPHTPIRGLCQTLGNLNGVNKALFEWPVPSLLFVFLLFASLTRDKWDFLLLTAFLSLTTAYFFYWFYHHRYLYEAAAPLIVLTARGIQRAPLLVQNVFCLSVSGRKARAATTAFVALCFLIAAVGNVPSLIRYYGHNFWGVNAEVLKAVEKQGIKKAVVFTRSYYGSVFAANSPRLDGDIVYARDLGEKNHLLMAAFPDYAYYLADGENIQLLEAK